MAWSFSCNDGVKLAGCSPCGWLSAGLYHLGIVPLQGLLSQHQCKGAEWIVEDVDWTATIVGYNSDSPSIVGQQ